MTSTIIGARRMAQLDANVMNLNVALTKGLALLDGLTKPTLGFPQKILPIFPTLANGGTTINGPYAPPMNGKPGEKPC